MLPARCSGVPLQVAVYAKGQASPALELGYTGQLHLGAPAASELTFTPPPGSTVITRTLGGPGTASGSGKSSSAQTGSVAYAPLTKNYGPTNSPAASGPSQVAKSGTGWATVLSGPAGQLLGSVEAGPLSEVTTVVNVNGQLGQAIQHGPA